MALSAAIAAARSLCSCHCFASTLSKALLDMDNKLRFGRLSVSADGNRVFYPNSFVANSVLDSTGTVLTSVGPTLEKASPT
jgi:hypothetical protein